MAGRTPAPKLAGRDKPAAAMAGLREWRLAIILVAGLHGNHARPPSARGAVGPHPPMRREAARRDDKAVQQYPDWFQHPVNGEVGRRRASW